MAPLLTSASDAPAPFPPNASPGSMGSPGTLRFPDLRCLVLPPALGERGSALLRRGPVWSRHAASPPRHPCSWRRPSHKRRCRRPLAKNLSRLVRHNVWTRGGARAFGRRARREASNRQRRLASLQPGTPSGAHVCGRRFGQSRGWRWREAASPIGNLNSHRSRACDEVARSRQGTLHSTPRASRGDLCYLRAARGARDSGIAQALTSSGIQRWCAGRPADL